MSKLLCCLLTISSFFFNPFSSSKDYEALYGENLISRFVLNTDSRIESIADIPFRSSWWSRPYEYAWAAQFVDENAVALDAACGISHPFKWYLGETCKEAWACDLDPRIERKESIIQETYDDLGEISHTVLLNNPQYMNNVNLVKASILSFPDSFPQFDRIFCISVLEHLTKADCKKALAEFEHFLAPQGLIILTVDYPEISPTELIAIADSVGLVPAGKISKELPTNHLLTNGHLSIFRCVLKHK